MNKLFFILLTDKIEHQKMCMKRQKFEDFVKIPLLR